MFHSETINNQSLIDCEYNIVLFNFLIQHLASCPRLVFLIYCAKNRLRITSVTHLLSRTNFPTRAYRARAPKRLSCDSLFNRGSDTRHSHKSNRSLMLEERDHRPGGMLQACHRSLNPYRLTHRTAIESVTPSLSCRQGTCFGEEQNCIFALLRSDTHPGSNTASTST